MTVLQNIKGELMNLPITTSVCKSAYRYVWLCVCVRVVGKGGAVDKGKDVKEQKDERKAQ